MDSMASQTASRISHDHFFQTDDGLSLHYLEFGHGRTILFIPGWSQTANLFLQQLHPLSKHFRCLALDLRGHGESENNGHGFTIDRLAADLQNFIEAKALDDIILVGHSMGAAVIWAYVNQFGAEKLAKLVFIDQAPVLMDNDAWNDVERSQYGGIFNDDVVSSITRGLCDEKSGVQTSRELLRGMFTEKFPAQKFEWVVSENLKMSRQSAAALLKDHCYRDWRSVIKNIHLPSLVVGGEESFMPWRSQQWISDNMPNAKLVIFKREERGQHFMFMENPAMFNKLICNFSQ
ncbi:MAG: alpha/beta hydrolase [Pseudomonadota bacterium]